MEPMLIVHISSLSAIIILSIVLLVNSIKTKNKLFMYLSIGTLVVSIGSLTYRLIHHFNDEHYKNKVKQLLKILTQKLINEGGHDLDDIKKTKNCIENDKKSIMLAYNIYKSFEIKIEGIDSDIKLIKKGLSSADIEKQKVHLAAIMSAVFARCYAKSK